MSDAKRIDVLAVLDAHIRIENVLAFGQPSEALDDLKKARAAVAELIEKANRSYAWDEAFSATQVAYQNNKSRSWVLKMMWEKFEESLINRIGATP